MQSLGRKRHAQRDYATTDVTNSHKVQCDVVPVCGEEAGHDVMQLYRQPSGAALLLLQPRTSCDRLRERCKLRSRRLPPLHGTPGHTLESARA